MHTYIYIHIYTYIYLLRPRVEVLEPLGVTRRFPPCVGLARMVCRRKPLLKLIVGVPKDYLVVAYTTHRITVESRIGQKGGGSDELWVKSSL